MTQNVYMIWYQYQQTILHQQLNQHQRRALLIEMLETTTTSRMERNQMADRMLGMESDLQADQYGHVQMEETTTTTMTTTGQNQSSRSAANSEMQKKRYEFANHFIATSQQANVPMSKVTQVAENIRNGKADDKVNEHFEKVRLGTVRSVQQQLPQPAQQPAVTAPAPQYGGYASSSSQAYKQSAASPPPPQQYGYAGSSSQAYKQSVASPPAPQQAYPPTPTYSAPTSMYGGHQYATTHTTTMTSTSSSSTQQAQQGYGVQSPGASYGYAQPLQQQLPAAGQPPLQLTGAPYDPSTIANSNQQGGGEQYDYPGSPPPVMAYAGGQEYGTSPQEYEQPLESPEYADYDRYEQDAGAPEQAVASTKAKKKKTSSKKTKK
ncbi:hypothetical protein B0A55_05202 [Friedmanniomyces simplex]|uniref:Uncharacterized protein n=1 Tax=Friedmanniomyces simplex TaxID=329884 RepID=A0A4U0XB87_9PEZI|nr:hypothetical protein B0A55_05202 [Friedmanniomyces simplex]